MEALMEASEAAASAGDLGQVAELDFEFHGLIGEAGGNHYLLEIQEMLSRLSTRFVYLVLNRVGTAGHHYLRSIAASSRRCDAVMGDAAAEAERDHYYNARDRTKAAL